MQRERGQRVKAACGQVIRVDEIDSGASSRGGIERRNFGGDGLDAEALSRQIPEVVGGDCVEFLGDEGGSHQQLLWRLRIELRVSAEEVEELRQRPLEAALLPRCEYRREHLSVNLCHLAEADGVDLIRRKRQRGELEDFGLVVGLAVGQRLRRKRGLRVRNVVVAEEREQVGVGGDDTALDRGGGLGAQLRLLSIGDARGHLCEGFEVDGALCGLRVGDRNQRRIAARQRDLRRCESAPESGAHVGDVLAEVARNILQLRDVADIVLLGLEGDAGDLFFIGPEGGVGVRRTLVLAERLVVDEADELRAEDLVVDALGLRQRGGLQRVDLSQHALPVLEFGLLGRGVDARQLRKNLLRAIFVWSAALCLAPRIFSGVEGPEAAVLCRRMLGRVYGRLRPRHGTAADYRKHRRCTN